MGRPKNKNSPPSAYKNLQLRAQDNTSLGKIITYIQNYPSNTQTLMSGVVEAWFLPFTIDFNDPNFREIAIHCARTCEARAATIREYAGLDQNLSQQPQTNSVSISEFTSSEKKADSKPDLLLEEEEIDTEGFDHMDDIGI